MVSLSACKVWQDIESAEPCTHGSIRFVPLVGPSSSDPAYRLFGTETAKKVKVSEVDEGGRVSSIKVDNGLDDRLLLIDGQELIGGRQNRALNTDVLVGAGAEVIVPVSCVEAGRWAHVGDCFSSGEMLYRSARAAKCLDIGASYRARRGPRANQREVWDGVADLLCMLDVRSNSTAMTDAYTKRRKELTKIRKALNLPTNAIGVAVYDRDRFVGLDLFDRATTLARQADSLISSYGIDWLAFAQDKRHDNRGPTLSVDELLETLGTAAWERYAAPGEGSTVRWEDKRCTASALVWGQDSVVHLQAFPRLNGGTRSRHIAAAAVPVVPAHVGPVTPPPPSVPQRQGERTGTRCERCGFLYGMVRTHEGDYCNHCGHPSR